MKNPRPSLKLESPYDPKGLSPGALVSVVPPGAYPVMCEAGVFDNQATWRQLVGPSN